MSDTHLPPNSGPGVPIVDPSRRFTVWNIDELYTDPTGKGQYVPNVDDTIIDYHHSCMWRVTYVDYTSFEYHKTPFRPVQEFNDDAEIGGCAPSQADTFRIYVDPSKHPQTLRVDSRLRFSGSDNDSIKIFRGRNIGPDGEVISGYFNSGNLVSTSIPLQLAALDHVDNKTIKSPVPGACTADVEDGELVTIVVYSDTDQVSCIALAYVVLTNLVQAVEAPSRQVIDIKLKSPFISPSDETLLELPINIPLDDIPLQCEIIYNDGKRLVNIDGTRTKLHGLRNAGAHDTFFVSTTLGQELDLLLNYQLGKNETYAGDNVVEGVIHKDYNARTMNVDGAYSVKLFVVPQWLDAQRGYRLNYYLYNLERGNLFDATPYVMPAVNTPAFDPTLYGVKQRLSVTVDLNKVSPVYLPHVHTQTFYITLLAQGNMAQDNFLLEYSHGNPVYGEDVAAYFHYDNVTHWMLDISCGAKSQVEWLDRLFNRIYPLFDHRTEDAAPVPTHVEVVTKAKTYLLSVDQWMNPFNVDIEVKAAETVELRWIARTPTDDLLLGTSPMLAKQRP